MNKKTPSNFILKLKQKSIPLIISLGLVLLFAILSVVTPSFIKEPLDQLENLFYDFQVKRNHKALSKEPQVTIIDIDDKSLKTQGRWPWPRKILADLISKLYQAGAVVIALDITFPEAEENIVNDVVKEINAQPDHKSDIVDQLTKMQSVFDYDERFAKSLALGDSVLGMVFINQGESTGALPPPYLKIDRRLQEQLDIPEKKDYLANIEVLQKAAKHGGFINASKDPDGVLRFTNLLFRRGDDVYASLSLQAVSLYLLAKNIELVTEQYGTDSTVLEGIKLDQVMIPTDYMGRILIPYRGAPFSFPYVSATDVLDGKANPASIEGKLIFIGFSAAALSDLYATPVDPVFPGVEVHATVASGILDQYLPYEPSWDEGIITFLIVTLGILCAVLFPFLGAILGTLLCLALTGGLLFGDTWLWAHEGIVLSTLMPLLLIWSLFILNIAWGYFAEAKKGKELKSIFGQYVPPAYLEEMMRKGGEINLEGESKELSVLFSDIRSFTSLSEKMTATELKQFLNRYFNPITEAIFKNKGTIDKYVGDMVMAFWGAPLEDPKHASEAVNAALEMQLAIKDLNQTLLQEKKPEVKAGIGINTGLMNVGDMGSRFRRSYTVLGDTVNLGSRLEGQSKFYHVDIIVGETTWQHTNQEFAFRKLDKIKVKGKETGVDIYQPLCKIENLTQELKEELDLHHEAIAAYFKQEWDKASKLFEQLKTSYPERAGLYDVYLSRIGQFRLEPYREGWDGSYVSLEK